MYLKVKHENFRIFAHVAFILLLIIFLTNVILQGSLAAEIKGKVVGINGENLNGAEVKIYNGTNLMHKAVTVNGMYAINLSEGNYFVVVTYIDKKENLYIDSTNLIIKQNETKSIDFSLTAPYTNFSDTYIPTLEDIFKIETNLTSGLQPNESNDTNLPSKGDTSSNMPLFIIIFVPTIILVFFYILYNYYAAKKTEEKIEKVETIIKTSKSVPTAISSSPSSAATDTTLTSQLAVENKQANVPISEKEEYKKKENEESEKKEDMIQKEREILLSSLTENERIVINLLMEHGGELLRTEISRGTNLPKSSLAMALKKLEDRKIIEIDKTFTIHRIKFTEWFKSFFVKNK